MKTSDLSRQLSGDVSDEEDEESLTLERILDKYKSKGICGEATCILTKNQLFF